MKIWRREKGNFFVANNERKRERERERERERGERKRERQTDRPSSSAPSLTYERDKRAKYEYLIL
jgi:hypothetical protein